jgi:type I restriction enzyme S subunit
LPPLGEQRRIAAILDQADAVRATRRQSLESIDDLTRALFLDIFGHPESPRPGAVVRPIGQVARIVTGHTPARNRPESYGGALEWIKSDNLGGVIATPADETLSAVGRQTARIAPAGSVLVTCIAGSPRSIGKTSMVDREAAFNQQINAIVPGPELRSRFILEQLRVAPGLVRAKSTGGMKGLVSKSAFESIEVLVPPTSEQEGFEEKMARVDGVRKVMTAEARRFDRLLLSLQSRAFAGGL